MTHIGHRELRKLASLVRAMQGLVDRLESRKIVLTPAQRERIERFRLEKRCLACENVIVEGEEIRRGCHPGCYNRVSMAISKGTITEQQAVDKGEWNPQPESPGRKPKYKKAVERAVAGLVEAVPDRDKPRDKPPAKRQKSRK